MQCRKLSKRLDLFVWTGNYKSNTFGRHDTKQVNLNDFHEPMKYTLKAYLVLECLLNYHTLAIISCFTGFLLQFLLLCSNSLRFILCSSDYFTPSSTLCFRGE